MLPSLKRLQSNGKSLFLAYDHGLEHGPSDFNELNVDPSFVMELAIKGRFNGIVFQEGIASRYYTGKVPLILKLNGKTALANGEPFSPLVSSVAEAIGLGASAVGYTIYLGSGNEPKIFSDFAKVRHEAHAAGLPVIAWVYARGSSIKNDVAPSTLAYCARVALELGADMVKLKYGQKFSWTVKCAGSVPVVVAGGIKEPGSSFLRMAADAMNSGASGFAVGRNIWQGKEPLSLVKGLKKIVFS